MATSDSALARNAPVTSRPPATSSTANTSRATASPTRLSASAL